MILLIEALTKLAVKWAWEEAVSVDLVMGEQLGLSVAQV
jgi:hypothetical protein